ncbi:MAG TPA: YciI family protein [Streptosporangiaceae bacterium]
MGGSDITECASLDEAVEIAARHPAAASGTIEVRHCGRSENNGHHTDHPLMNT